MPADEKLAPAAQSGGKTAVAALGGPFPGEVIAVDVDRPELQVNISTLKEGEENKTERTLLLHLSSPKTAYVVHPSNT